jgi:hypothetical protein
MRGLDQVGLTALADTPDVASEGALWGAMPEEGRLGEVVIVSDGAGLPGLDPGIRVGLREPNSYALNSAAFSAAPKPDTSRSTAC